jgi:hypothetical protein
LPLFTRGAISIPDHPVLLRELRLLERQTHRGGKDSVDHPKRGNDDFANALCGCAVHATKGAWDPALRWAFGPLPGEQSAEQEAEQNRRWRQQRLNDYVLTGGYSGPRY